MTTQTMRGVCLVGSVLFSLIIGICTGVLTYLGGDHPAKATIAGAAGFGATLTLMLLILAFLTSAAPVAQSDDDYSSAIDG